MNHFNNSSISVVPWQLDDWMLVLYLQSLASLQLRKMKKNFLENDFVRKHCDAPKIYISIIKIISENILVGYRLNVAETVFRQIYTRSDMLVLVHNYLYNP